MESDLNKEVKDSLRILAYWNGNDNGTNGFASILKSHMISVITSPEQLPHNITRPKVASIENLTKIINSVTIMMGNVVRILRDEKNYINDREIKPVKLECNFQNQKTWDNGLLVMEAMKELMSRFPTKKTTLGKAEDKCQQWDNKSPQQYQETAQQTLRVKFNKIN